MRRSPRTSGSSPCAKATWCSEMHPPSVGHRAPTSVDVGEAAGEGLDRLHAVRPRAGTRGPSPRRRRRPRRSVRVRRAASPASATERTNVVGEQAGRLRRLLELPARVASADVLDEVGREPRQLADRRRCLREPRGDRARRLHRRVLVVVDRPVGEHRDVRTRPPGLRRAPLDVLERPRERLGEQPDEQDHAVGDLAGELERLRATRGDVDRDVRPGREPQVRVVERERVVLDADVRLPTRAPGSPRSMRGASRASWASSRARAAAGRPAPIPRIIRPPEISSTVAAAAAVIAGWRVSGFVTAVPSRSRDERRRRERQVRVGVARVQRRIREPQVREAEPSIRSTIALELRRAGRPPGARRPERTASCRSAPRTPAPCARALRSPRSIGAVSIHSCGVCSPEPVVMPSGDRRGSRARARRSRRCSSRRRRPRSALAQRLDGRARPAGAPGRGGRRADRRAPSCSTRSGSSTAARSASSESRASASSATGSSARRSSSNHASRARMLIALSAADPADVHRGPLRARDRLDQDDELGRSMDRARRRRRPPTRALPALAR